MANRLTDLAKNLRKRSTDTEHLLWKHLRASRFDGLKFKRQQPIGNYIVDFVCFEKRVIIELDGGHHSEKEQMQKDLERDLFFEKQGYKVLRIWDNEVFRNTRGVLEVIWDQCLNHPPPAPSHQGRGEHKV